MSLLNKLFLIPRRFSDFEMYLLLTKVAKKHDAISYQTIANIAQWKVAEIKTFANVNGVNFLRFVNDTSIQLWYAKEQDAFIAKYSVPERYRCDEFLLPYMQYVKSRKGIKVSTAQNQFDKLNKYPIEVCIQAINNSTSNGWVGLFPEKILISKTTTYNANIKSESEW